VQHDDIAKIIDAAFERRAEIGAATTGAVPEAVDEALDLLDRGAARVAEKQPDGSWHVNQWLKKAVLLSFRLADMSVMRFGTEPGARAWAWDKRQIADFGDQVFRASAQGAEGDPLLIEPIEGRMESGDEECAEPD